MVFWWGEWSEKQLDVMLALLLALGWEVKMAKQWVVALVLLWVLMLIRKMYKRLNQILQINVKSRHEIIGLQFPVYLS